MGFELIPSGMLGYLISYSSSKRLLSSNVVCSSKAAISGFDRRIYRINEGLGEKSQEIPLCTHPIPNKNNQRELKVMRVSIVALVLQQFLQTHHYCG